MLLNSWHAPETGSGALVSPLKGMAKFQGKGADNTPTNVLYLLSPSLVFPSALVNSDLFFQERGYVKQDWILLPPLSSSEPAYKIILMSDWMCGAKSCRDTKGLDAKSLLFSCFS